MIRNVIITFDYELFLGRETGTIENCVIRPTQLILDILIRNSAKAIFFVDATWLLFLRENFPRDFQQVSDQLKDIKKSGSSIELHLHPHWIHAYKMGNKIGFKSFHNYRLHSLSNQSVLDLFGKSIKLLESITLQKISCFRAGGFCIEPFNQIKDAFETFGIKYDFSVVPGIFLNDGTEYDFDFTDAPNISFYSFENNIRKQEQNGQFIEVPLSIYQNSPVFRLLNKIMLVITRDKIFGDGTGIQDKSFYFLKSLNRRFRFSKGMLSIDKTYSLLFKYLLKMQFSNSNLLVLLSHPKLVSKQALTNLFYISKNFNTLNTIELNQYLSGK